MQQAMWWVLCKPMLEDALGVVVVVVAWCLVLETRFELEINCATSLG